jgi:hypothetical protein
MATSDFDFQYKATNHPGPLILEKKCHNILQKNTSDELKF